MNLTTKQKIEAILGPKNLFFIEDRSVVFHLSPDELEYLFEEMRLDPEDEDYHLLKVFKFDVQNAFSTLKYILKSTKESMTLRTKSIEKTTIYDEDNLQRDLEAQYRIDKELIENLKNLSIQGICSLIDKNYFDFFTTDCLGDPSQPGIKFISNGLRTLSSYEFMKKSEIYIDNCTA